MKTIQVDMFAVGLGASVLTQFVSKNGSRVTVLSDGGMGAGHSANTVKEKLPESFKAFGNHDRICIDLIVGTHYDGDHLKGLVPMIEDSSIDIGEIWLPPVKNDAEAIPGTLEADEFLADAFFDDDESRKAAEYLRKKAHRVDDLQRWENRIVENLRGSGDSRDRDSRNSNVESSGIDLIETRRHLHNLRGSEAINGYLRFFEAHRDDALRRANSQPIHESATYDSRKPVAQDILANISGVLSEWPFLTDWEWHCRHNPEYCEIIPSALATLRAAEASGAITAIHLNAVIVASRKRQPAIRPRCRFISEGHPAQFVWSLSKKRFVRSETGDNADLILTLLGPSEQLIERHSEKLPVWKLAYASMLDTNVIPREGITASNQLSYIFTIAIEGQRILISGDAGCYKFRKFNNEFHKNFLRALKSLAIVQIAHHGGRNYDFYHSLIAAGFDKQQTSSFLLLSHGLNDKHRPSRAFESFISRLRRKENEPRLLFTSMPQDSKIEPYRELVHPAVSLSAEEGDVRLSYDNSEWRVDSHAIKVKPQS